MMEKYYYIETRVPLELEDEIDATAHQKFQTTGIEEFSIDEPRVDEILGDRSYSGGDLPVSVLTEVEEVVKSDGNLKKYHFSDESSALNLKAFLHEEYKLDSQMVTEEVKDWNEEWKKSYAPIVVGSDLEIIPAWDKSTYESKSQKKIFIYPGMGFGTGSHETTFLCLTLFLDVLKKSNRFEHCLDFGCGSGILGIATKLFDSESRIDLYDIDNEALTNSIQNIELNELLVEEFELLLPDSRSKIERKYNLVYANILQNVLLLEKKFLTSCLNKGGFLILSGLLSGQEIEVIAEYKKINPNLQHISTVSKGDWVAVLMELN
jgi:ribosomal protein L11 methyltransferase